MRAVSSATVSTWRPGRARGAGVASPNGSLVTVLPAGTLVTLPDLPRPLETIETVKLWD